MATECPLEESEGLFDAQGVEGLHVCQSRLHSLKGPVLRVLVSFQINI